MSSSRRLGIHHKEHSYTAMLEHRRTVYSRFVKILHMLTFMAAFMVSFTAFLGYISPKASFATDLHTELIIYTLFSYAVIYIVSDHLTSRHMTFNLPSLRANALYVMVTSVAICVILSMVTLLFYKGLSPLQPVAFLIATPIIYIPLQWLYNTIFAYINNRPHNQRHIIIVGTNQRALAFAESIGRQEFLGIRILGFVDDTDNPPPGVNLLGTSKDFRRILRENVVDAVVIKLPVRTFYDEITELIALSEEQGIATYFLNNFFEPKSCEVTAHRHGNTSSIIFHSAPLEDWKMLLKRMVSLVSSVLAVIVLSPIMLIIAVAIYIQDPGPILYVQKRIGYRKRIFNLYKFRSMYQNAPELQAELEARNEMDGPVFKIRNDPRITPVGQFLRKFSLDELPQFFNVIKGDMNLVGPRPLALRDYGGFREDWLRKRFSVPPGLTCYWQSMVNRNDLSFEEWMRLDMLYIDHCSLWDDFKICLKTAHTVIAGKGV